MTAERGALFQLGDGEIRGGHVCALFDGADDLYAQLTPFIADGVERGERAVHIVDPSKRENHLARLGGAGIDVDSATDRGQLEVGSWPEFYLVGGRFQPEVTVKLLKATLDAGRERGYQATRVIGLMDWALERAPGVDAIARYETIVDADLRSSTDAVVCAYDVRRHRPSMLVDLLAVHAYTLIEGQLRKRTSRGDPRRRILATAARLFHRHGIAATGIDRVIAEAGVAKATFYRHYPSKEDLVLAWIHDPATRWFDVVFERAHERAASPEDVISAVFDGTAEWLELDGYRGCPYLNTISELADVHADHPVRAGAKAYLVEIGERLGGAAASAGADPAIGAQLQALLSGGIELAAASRSREPIDAARSAAVQVMTAARRSRGRGSGSGSVIAGG